MYKVKEIYYTLQGEGFHTGRPAVFCRFSGCNLWSGREVDRQDAICNFCDTDFWGTDGHNGGKYKAAELVATCSGLWPHVEGEKFVVFTGGEPLLQLDNDLLLQFKNCNFYTAVETNGTLPCPDLIDWICMSPKAKTNIVVKGGDEIKIVYPQQDLEPLEFGNLQFDHFYLQPMDSPKLKSNTALCVEFCKKHPAWKLSLQTHKIIGID